MERGGKTDAPGTARMSGGLAGGTSVWVDHTPAVARGIRHKKIFGNRGRSLQSPQGIPKGPTEPATAVGSM
jgi:hypothetical protein